MVGKTKSILAPDEESLYLRVGRGRIGLVTEETKEMSAEAGSGGSRFWWDQNMKLHELKQYKTSLEDQSHLQQRTFIQMGTILQVADNSGAKKVRCIQALNASKKGARLGDTIVASVTEGHLFNAEIERKHQKEEKKKITGKGAVVYAVVVRAAMQRGRCDGSEVKFDDNAVVLVDKNIRQPLGTRVFGPVPHELRKKKHLKILSLAQHVA